MQPLESRCKRPDLLLMKESEARGPEGIFFASHRADGSNNTATGTTGSTLFEILAFAREFREHSTHAVQPSRSLGKLSPHLRTVAPRIFDSSASTIPCPCEQNDRSFYQNQKQSNLFIQKTAEEIEHGRQGKTPPHVTSLPIMRHALSGDRAQADSRPRLK